MNGKEWTREEIVKALSVCGSIEGGCSDCPVIGVGDVCVEKLLLASADMLERDGSNSRWIPVTERLPDMAGMSCLLTVVNQYGQRAVAKGFTGYNRPGDFGSNDMEVNPGFQAWTVLAWQPLPEPYVIEEDADA